MQPGVCAQRTDDRGDVLHGMFGKISLVCLRVDRMIKGRCVTSSHAAGTVTEKGSADFVEAACDQIKVGECRIG